VRRRIAAALVGLVFAAGLGLLLYPSVSGYVNARRQTRVVESYREDVGRMDGTELLVMLELALEYNYELALQTDRWAPMGEEARAVYAAQLNVAGRGVMGTLEIPVIGVSLPIYHSTGANVLQVGIGHLEGSSLPVGGESSHCVITGHRGLPSSVLLTDLNRMEPGDDFTLRVLGRAFTYRVDQIRTVLPNDFSELEIIPGKDYCTLLTCTPYGINSHRLLVRGERVDVEEDVPEVMAVMIRTEAEKIGLGQVLLFMLAPVLVVLFFRQLFAAASGR
jgi:sortase A